MRTCFDHTVVLDVVCLAITQKYGVLESTTSHNTTDRTFPRSGEETAAQSMLQWTHDNILCVFISGLNQRAQGVGWYFRILSYFGFFSNGMLAEN